MQEAVPQPPNQRRNRLLYAGIAAVAAAIVVVFAIGNFASSQAGECPAQPAPAALIDAAATGALAAMNGTGQGRGYKDMAFTDAAGQPVTIGDFKGKKLLVNFWASWCIPCRAEMPELDAVAGKYNSDTFMVLPIDLDVGAGGLEKAKAFLAGGQWPNLPLYADPSFRVFDRLKSQAVTIGLPATLLLDANGCELAVLQGPAAWNTPDGEAVIKALIGA